MLDDERQVVEDVIREVEKALPFDASLAFRALMWEDQPPDFGRPQSLLNPMANECDVFVGLLADRWGTPTGEYESGFEEEFEIARKRRNDQGEDGPAIWLFFTEPKHPEKSDAQQLEKVLAFKNEIKSNQIALIKDFDSLADLRRELHLALGRFVGTRLQAHDSTAVVGSGSRDDIAPARLEVPIADSSTDLVQPTKSAITDDWHEALVSGPLSEAGQTERERRALEIADRNPSEAASMFETVSTELLGRGFPELADVYASRAAHLFETSGDTGRASELLETTFRRELARGSQRAVYSARRLLDLLPEEQRLMGLAYLAQADWPERPGWALEKLEDAIAEMSRNGVPLDDARRLELAAAAIDVLMIQEQYDSALSIAASYRELPLALGSRLLIELDALDAMTTTDVAEEAVERGWTVVADFVSPLNGREMEWAAIACGRRGVHLATTGRVELARSSFAKAASYWQEGIGHGQQVSEAFFASVAASTVNSEFFPDEERIRPWAASFAGDDDTPASRAESAIESAMSNRLNRDFPDSVRAYWYAYAEHRRAGNLRGMLFTLGLLGEVYEATEHWQEATWAYVRSGREKGAANAVKNVSQGEIADLLDIGRARWRRSASYAAIAAAGSRMSRAEVDRVADRIIGEAAQDTESVFGHQPITGAHEALAAVVFELPGRLLDAGIARLREIALGWHVTSVRAATRALMLATNAELSDESEALVDAFLRDASLGGIDVVWLGEALERRPDLQAAVLTAASDGHHQALVACAVAGLPESDPALVKLCELQVEREIQRELVTRRVAADGSVSESTEISGDSTAGILARFCKQSLAVTFVEKMIDDAFNADAPIMNRIGAVNSVFNAADAVPNDTAESIAGQLRRLIDQPVAVTGRESHDDDQLSRFRFSMGTSDELKAAAIGAWGRLRRRGESLDDAEQRVISQMLTHGGTEILAATLSTLGQLGQLSEDHDPAPFLRHASADVRAAAVSYWFKRLRNLPDDESLRLLRSDPNVVVRLTLLFELRNLGEPGNVLIHRELEADSDSYVRALARAS